MTGVHDNQIKEKPWEQTETQESELKHMTNPRKTEKERVSVFFLSPNFRHICIKSILTH